MKLLEQLEDILSLYSTDKDELIEEIRRRIIDREDRDRDLYWKAQIIQTFKNLSHRFYIFVEGKTEREAIDDAKNKICFEWYEGKENDGWVDNPPTFNEDKNCVTLANGITLRIEKVIEIDVEDFIILERHID